MMRNKRVSGLMMVLFLLVSFFSAAEGEAAAPPPTVSVISPDPGTAASPRIVSLSAGNTTKVRIQVWNDVADITLVQAGYCLSSLDPNVIGNWTFVNAAQNANYSCGTNCGVYEADIPLAAGNSYFIRGRATSTADGIGYSSDNRTGNDARYIYVTAGAFKTGTGSLLARDASAQLCMDCHSLQSHSSQSTDAGYGNWNIVCGECHTPHNTRNIMLIQDTIVTPNSGSRAVKYYNRTGDADNSFVDSTPPAGTPNGVCQVCHTQTRNPGNAAARWRNTGNADNHYDSASGTAACTDCHVHLEGFKGSCNSCHLSPPATGKHATHFGAGNVGYGFTNIQSTPASYSFSCGICHYGTHLNTLPQANNPHTAEVIFAGIGTSGWDPDNPSPGMSSYAPAAFSVDNPGTGWTFNYSDGSCANTYCHGNYPGSGLNASPTFETGTAPCGSCHKAANNDWPESGRHKKHASNSQTSPLGFYNFFDKEYPCTMCHKGIVGGSGPASYSVSDKSKHVSGYIDWNFDTNDIRLKGGSEAYTIASGTAKPSDGTTPRAYGQCNNVYCHSIVQKADGSALTPNSADYKPLNWSAPPSWGCTCHGSANLHNGGALTSGSHTRHLSYSYGLVTGTMEQCTLCHKWNPSAATFDCNQCHGSLGEKTQHVNGLVDVVFDTYFGSGTFNGTPLPGDGYAASSCSNTYCHSTGTSVSTGSIPANTSALWGSGVVPCNACHGTPNGSPYASGDYRKAAPLYADGSPKKNAHQLHVRAGASTVTDPSCAMCHQTVTSTNTTITGTGLHVNKLYNVAQGGSYPRWSGSNNGSSQVVSIGAFTFNAAESTCTSVSCHPDGGSGTTTKWSTGYSCTDCHNIDLTTTAYYQHVMNASVLTSRVYPTSAPSSSSVSDTNRKCTMCHVDHNIFSPMLNAGSTGRAYNLRTDITSAPSATTPAAGNYTNMDFNNALTNGGICVSCHQSELSKNATNQRNDNTTKTPVITKTAYNMSSHNYTTTSAYTSTPSGNFSANCMKCHNSNTFGKTFQNTTNKFKLHASVSPPVKRLLASLGAGTSGAFAYVEDYEEQFCYRCHTTFAQAATIGGTAKTAANYDWYGSVTNMTAASQDILTSMQRGTPGSPAPTTLTNILYLRDSGYTPAPLEPMPNAYILNSGTYSSSTYRMRGMVPAAGATQETITHNTANGSGVRYFRTAQFLSPPIKTGFTWPVNTSLTFTLRVGENNANNNCNTRYSIYQWTSGDAQGTQLFPVVDGAEYPTTAATQTLGISTTNEVTFAPNDKILLEVEMRAFNPANTGTCTLTWGGADISALSWTGNQEFITGTATPASGMHDVAQYSGIHRPSSADETRAYIAANKHVECNDCHDPHEAKAGIHTKGTNTLANVLSGVSGVTVTTWGGNWAGVTTWGQTTTQALPTATTEWQVCFKCHSSANANVTSWGGSGPLAWTDLALEFNPNNLSRHPVISPLPTGGTGVPRGLAAGALTGGWTPGQVMTCSDCHSTDSAASKGPHGSSVKWMLNPNTTVTKYYNWPYTSAAMNGSNSAVAADFVRGTGTATVPTNNFCFSCHTWSGGGGAHTGCNSHTMACVGCHIRVPHGGKVPRLLTTTNVPDRYRPSGQAGGYATYLGSITMPNTGTIGINDCQAAGGCTAGEHNQAETYSW